MKELIEIQSELKAPKWQRNTFGNYNYRSAEDILNAVKPLLKKHECILTISDEMVEVWGRIYVKATAKIENEKTQIEVNWYAREPESQKGMSESQITWTASSYARKYALNWLFAIDDTKDADTNEHKAESEEKEKKEVYKNDTKPWVSKTENCPKCWAYCDNIKKGTTKIGKPYEMWNCKCWEKFFINRA